MLTVFNNKCYDVSKHMVLNDDKLENHVAKQTTFFSN